VIVILGAIFSYNVMQATKALDILRDILASISEDKRIQAVDFMVFADFFEAAAGYGTAVYSDRYSYRTGIQPAEGGDCLSRGNTVPTAFGAVGIPVSILAGTG
jgi:lactate permease